MAFQEQVYSFYSVFTAMGYIFMGKLPFVGAVVTSYILLFVGAGFQYLVSLAIYRKPLSKRAQGAAMKRYLKYGFCQPSRGSITTKMLPLPGWLFTFMEP